MPEPEPAAPPPVSTAGRGEPLGAVAPPGDTSPGRARSAADRAADHRSVERLTSDLVPALIARLASSGLAELEVREGDWKVRLRRPLEVVGSGRRSTDRLVRLPAGAPVGPAAVLPPGGHPAGRSQAGPVSTADPIGARAGPAQGRVPGRSDGRTEDRAERRSGRPVATSPAVGIFRPRNEISGTEVQAGDRLGAVDMLGIPQEVVAPIDGVVGDALVEPGDAVESGQALFAIEPGRALPPAGAIARGGAAPASEAVPVGVEDRAAPVGERP